MTKIILKQKYAGYLPESVLEVDDDVLKTLVLYQVLPEVEPKKVTKPKRKPKKDDEIQAEK